MSIVILSPHYDDAIYSLGGVIHQNRRDDVLIWTLMGGKPQPPYPDSPIIRDVHERWQAGDDPVQRRIQEDQDAAAIAGARVQVAPLLDCIYRTDAAAHALYPDEDSLWDDIHPQDSAPQQLRQLGLSDHIHEIYAPLGVGGHVDHLIVRDWALSLLDRYTIYLYTDYPYLRDTQAIQQALASTPARLEKHDIHLEEADMKVKIAAMQSYQSQISTFWKDADAMNEDIRATFYESDRGVYRETVYRVLEARI